MKDDRSLGEAQPSHEAAGAKETKKKNLIRRILDWLEEEDSPPSGPTSRSGGG